MPIRQRLKGELARAVRCLATPCASIKVPEEYGSMRAVLAAQFEQHQFRLIVELNAEPVPSDLIRGELFGEPFVIHPGACRQPGCELIVPETRRSGNET